MMEVTIVLKSAFDEEEKKLYLTEDIRGVNEALNYSRNELYSLREDEIKKALIKLGWTPPNKTIDK